MSNLVPACQRCNRSKGSEEWTEWFRKQITWSAFREADINQWMSKAAAEQDRVLPVVAFWSG